MSESKSLLARLLSKENISVQHGNYTTAFFDVQNRILGLPLWKNDDKDLHDMLVGHEVGHALYTPAEGWVDMQSAANDDRVPGDYLNVVEDIRIERKIQETYPGIVRSFKKGYSYLSESDFFGLNGRDVNSMGLMDRINLKAKLRDLIEVEFSDVERPLVNRAFAADTWDEVVEAARDLYEFVRQNPDSQPQDDNGNSNKPTDGDSQDQSDGPTDPLSGENDSQQEQESTNHETNDSQDSEDGSQDEASNSSDASESGGDSDSKESLKDPSAGDGNEEVETYRNATENAENLLEKNDGGGLPAVIRGMTRAQLNDAIVPFEKVRAAREEKYRSVIDSLYKKRDDPNAIGFNDERVRKILEGFDTNAKYKEFVTETKRVVNVMAKEFELRKAAHQYSRASTARSGALDLERLHEYKTNDDIFRRVTTLADAKSHGMVMLIDNSASMHESRGAVIGQVLSLAMFCKRVNIPFDVYSFTSPRFGNNGFYEITEDQLAYDSVIHTGSLVTHVLSSSFSRRQYDVAYRQLFDLSCDIECYEGRYDIMSGTPLNDILTGMHLLLKDFKRRHQIQRMIFTVLTDGDSNMLSVSHGLRRDMSKKDRTGLRIVMDESSRVCRPKNRSFYDTTYITKYLLNSIREEVPGLVNLGYFIANDTNEFKRAVCRASYPEDPAESVRLARKEANQNKFVSYDNVIGYDRYFVLRSFRSKDLSATDDEFEVSDHAKRAEITRAFKKYAKSKKGNRVLATQFAEIIS